MYLVKTQKIDVGTIKDVEGTGFEEHLVKDVDVMHKSIGNPSGSRDVASKVEECVQFNAGLCLAELGPREER